MFKVWKEHIYARGVITALLVVDTLQVKTSNLDESKCVDISQTDIDSIARLRTMISREYSSIMSVHLGGG